MGRYLDPRNDIPFKRVFGEHPELLKNFLNAMMPFEKEQYIESLEYLSWEQVPDNPAKKSSIVNVRCKDNHGRQFIVEAQVLWRQTFFNRMAFTASKAYDRDVELSEDFCLPEPVYGVGILDYVFDSKTAEYYHHYRTVCDKNDKIIKGLEFVVVECPKFVLTNTTEKNMAALWLRFFHDIREGVYIKPAPELMENKYIRQAIELCDQGSFTDPEMYAYDRCWDVIRTQKAVTKTNITEGYAQGYAEIYAKGYDKCYAKDSKIYAKRYAKGLEKGLAEAWKFLND